MILLVLLIGGGGIYVSSWLRLLLVIVLIVAVVTSASGRRVERQQGLFDAAMGMAEAAAAQSRVEIALSESRLAKLRAAAELEAAGRMEEAGKLLAEVRAEQERARLTGRGPVVLCGGCCSRMRGRPLPPC